MSARSKRNTIRFEMLITKEVCDSWRFKAEKAGISKAELVRRRMAGCQVKTIPEANWQCYWQLQKIETSLNQIVKAQNNAIANGLVPPPIEPIPFEQLAKEIDMLRSLLILGSNEEKSNDLEDDDDWED